jgi:hypothetical protein
MSFHRYQPSTAPHSRTLGLALACPVTSWKCVGNLRGFADSKASDQEGIT